MQESNSQKRGPDATAKVVRCPYCIEAGAFKPMNVDDDGDRHSCGRCGHLVLLTNPQFECACAKCVHLRGPAFHMPHSIQ